MTWDFAEAGIFSDAAGDYGRCIGAATEVLDRLYQIATMGEARQVDAANLAIAPSYLYSTDPPYYDNVGYADLSDYFYIWLRRSLNGIFPELMGTVLTPKADELVADPFRHNDPRRFFENGFRDVFRRIREGAVDDYPIAVFYAFKQAESGDHGNSSTGWETLLEGMIQSGWQVSGTWPMRTELESRNRSRDSNALASSIVLACRPRVERRTIDRRGFLPSCASSCHADCESCSRETSRRWTWRKQLSGREWRYFPGSDRLPIPTAQLCRFGTALQLINQVLDEVLSEQEGDFDTDSRWCVKWFEQYEWTQGESGTAETLATALNTSLHGLERAGVVLPEPVRPDCCGQMNFPDDYNPGKDSRPTMWEAVLHLSKHLEKHGPESAGQLMRQLQSVMDLNGVKELAYLLYNICDRKRRQESALIFNNLVTSWPEIADEAQKSSGMAEYVQAMDFTDD